MVNEKKHERTEPRVTGDVRCMDGPLRLAGLALQHHPEPLEGAYVLAGHIHPAAVLGGRAHDRLRLPCFHFGPAVGVLPAFGAFTGMHVLPRGLYDFAFARAGRKPRNPEISS